MRLIDAYALQEEIHKSKMQNTHKDAKVATNHEFEHDHFMRMVVLQPTAQNEIVRCKDCIHNGHCGIQFQYADCNENWFCADGERKEGR